MAWLQDPRVYPWLDFGEAGQIPSFAALRLMLHRNTHRIFLFAETPLQPPIGIVALSGLHPTFRTANLWYVLGEANQAGRGLTTRAVSRLLEKAFQEWGLEAIQAWTVEGNQASIRVLERNHFRFAGRLRRCHWIGGIPRDRLLFDLLREEYRPIEKGDPI